MLRGRRVACSAFVAVALHATAAAAGDPAAAREQLKIGWSLSQAGKCPEAIAHLEESLRLDPKAVTLINLANCQEKVGRLAEALGHWVDARTRARSEGDGAIEEEAVKRATALEKRMPKLTVAVSGRKPAGMEVVRDGVVLGAVSIGTPLPVNPGRHTILVRAPGREPSSTEVEIREGETKTVDVHAGPLLPSQPVDRPRPTTIGTSPLVWIGFGAAALGLGVGTVTGLMAMSRADACPDRVCPDRDALDGVQEGRTLGWISTAAFAVGAVGLGVGIVALAAGGKKSDPTVALGVGSQGALVRGRF